MNGQPEPAARVRLLVTGFGAGTDARVVESSRTVDDCSDVLVAIATINVWNRICVPTRREPAQR